MFVNIRTDCSQRTMGFIENYPNVHLRQLCNGKKYSGDGVEIIANTKDVT